MRYLSIFMGSFLFSLFGFSQNAPTVTLVFVSSANNSYKNFEAVIDEVSYYSEKPSVSNNKSRTMSTVAVDRNTIWLNNFQPGKHTIEVYKIETGSHNQRAGNSPVYASTFIIKKGFDTKIAVTSSGQVQFSERANTGNIPFDVSGNDNNKAIDKNPGEKVKHSGNNSRGRKSLYQGNSITGSDKKNEDSYSKENNDVTDRHSRKRIDTAIIMANGNIYSRKAVHEKNQPSKSNDKDILNDGPHQLNDNGNTRMNDDQFTQLYERLRNQWHPGQRMKTLTNQFLNGGDYFTTSQAKQLIKLLTEEGNRLKLAKSSYQRITDPENFSEMDDILHYKASRKELDNFVKNEQN